MREAIEAEQRKATFSETREKEIDGAYFGGHIKPKNEVVERVDRRAAEEQTGKRQVVVVMRERKGRTLPFVCGKESDAIPAIRERIPLGSIVHADEARGWDTLHAHYDMGSEIAEWDRLVGELASLRLLTNLDRAALAAYCGAYALWAEATEAIQKFGTMVKSPSGYPIQSPYVSIANRQAEIMMRIASEFGFTPASRGRISTPSKASRTLFDLLENSEDEPSMPE